MSAEVIQMRPALPAAVAAKLDAALSPPCSLWVIEEDAELASLVPEPSDAQLKQIHIRARQGMPPQVHLWWDGESHRQLGGLAVLELCRDHKIEPKFIVAPVSSREEAMTWVLEREFSEPARTAAQRAYVVGKLYLARKQQGASRQAGEKLAADDVAERFGLSKRGVERAAQFATQVDELAVVHGASTRRTLLDRSVVGARLRRLRELDRDGQQQALQDLGGGGSPASLKHGTSSSPNDKIAEAVAVLFAAVDTGQILTLNPERQVELARLVDHVRNALARQWAPANAAGPPGGPRAGESRRT